MNQIPIEDITPRPKGKVETYDLYAKREHIYVKFYKGIFKNLRIISSAVMLVMFYGFSWLQWDGRQAILFDLPNRQFHVFGMTFWPQDFVLLSALLIILAFTLFFVTVFAGRLWCGYACPQFVWTWLFMWAERITEGDRNQRMRMDKKPMGKEKLLRKAAKHTLWLVIALLSAIAFVGYFTPIRELLPNTLSLSLGPWELWWIGFITVATYGNAGWLREQVCTYMCPYARFQSVMFDQDTLVISYDSARGENRGRRKRKIDYKAAGLGDCIDCQLCVNVCPVGIDIRDGLQYECVACGACVDACDDVMRRIGYPTGLIRYTTEHQLEGKETKIIRPRLIGYLVVLLVMCGAFAYTLTTRVPLELDVLRERGQLFTKASNGNIENAYSLKLANKQQQPHRYQISVQGPAGLTLVTEPTLVIDGGELRDLPVRLQLAPEQMVAPNSTIVFRLQSLDNPEIQVEVESRFIGPQARR